MMVVILIIAILAALTAAGTFQFIETQRNNNTHTAMRTLDKVLQEQWDKVIADARKETPSDAVVGLAGSGDNNASRAKVIWVYFRLVEAFPLSFDEIRAAPTNLYIPFNLRRHNTTYKRGIPATGSGSTSACLYLALTQDRGGVSLKPDLVASNLAGSGTVKELIDSWDNPLRFERFPVNAELDGQSPAAKGSRSSRLRDPLDPDGWLLKTDPWNTAEFERVTGLRLASINMFRKPTIISNGRDGLAGTNDDIYGFRLRLGTRGD
jgi:type II secretory pathway pseudopilin PulG